MLQGGLGGRFIPELSDKTKTLIAGFFKITQDDSLRDQALKTAEQVELDDDDTALGRIATKAENSEHASLDGVDYLE